MIPLSVRFYAPTVCGLRLSTSRDGGSGVHFPTQVAWEPGSSQNHKQRTNKFRSDHPSTPWSIPAPSF